MKFSYLDPVDFYKINYFTSLLFFSSFLYEDKKFKNVFYEIMNYLFNN